MSASERRPPASATADEMDRVIWDYDPEDDLASPLVKTERYFRDFPWDVDDEKNVEVLR